MSREYYNLNEVLRWRAEHSPNQPAFTFLKDGGEEDAQWSYAKLDNAARAIAGRLQESVAIGQRVLLLFPPSLEFVAAFWGCLYAGAIAVPAYPVRSQANVRRLKNIVKDCQPSAVLITRRGLLRMKNAIDSDLAALQWIETDSLSQGLADAWLEPQISKESIALLQYTSGSTGQPKGVVVSHGNLLHNEEIIQSTFRQSQDSVIVGWLPLYHDMGLMGTMLQPVYAGARCILMSPNAFLQRPFRWLEAISRYRATTSGGPNFAYELCVRKITDEERATLDLSTWSVAFNGAETVRAETLEKFAARFAAVGFSAKSFRPCYGLAEATLLVSAQSSKQQARHLTIDANQLGDNQVKVVPAGTGAIDVVSCGRTAYGHEVVIVDPETLRRRAPNQVGEIWVAGSSVAQGYWNRPEDTACLFAARTTDTREGPFLRTGDLGFIRNGDLFITGRCKDLIIIRGRNHYPQDIELTVQASHPAFKPGLGAAFSVPGEQGECLVVVQEVEHGKEQQLNEAIDSICQAIAEQHEIQTQAVLLLHSGTIPRTSSGKIQRYLCRDLFLQEKLSPIEEWHAGTGAPISSSVQPVLKSTEGIQEWLAEKLAARAGVAHANILVHESISRYGLDSLASIELSHAAERELALSLPLSSLMQSKSIVELTRELMNDKLAFEELQSESQAGNVIEEITLSEGQKSLWYLHQLAPESTAYNLAFVARIVNGADTRVLQQIFQTLAERHSSLRTTFHANDTGEPFQRIHPLQNAAVVEIDASGWSDSVLEQHFQQEADTHFNLELGPLFRLTLFHRSDSECFIAITLHHIIGDLWSLAMLLHEMGRLYAAETKGTRLTLPALESSYSHFVFWQRQMLSGAEGARHQAYWTSQLEGELPVLELSTDRMRPTIQTYHGAAKTFDLSAELTQGLRNVSHNNNTTLNVILLAAFQVLLHRHSGQRDVLVGSPAANRMRASWANVFGYFVNPVVLRSRLERNLPFDEFLAETHTTVVEALEHQHYPFSTLVEKLQPERDLSRSPLFQVMFVFEKTSFLEEEGISAFALGGKGTRLEFNGLTFESVFPESTKALFDLMLRVAEAGEETRCSFEYNTDLFDAETISRMAKQWRQLLHGIVAAETTPVRELPLLNEAERKQMVEEWNRTEREYPQRWMQELFEDQVKRSPEAVAVAYEDRQLKYQELNRRANQLAHYLRSMGVGPEVRVGICMERSLEMVVGLLGVLKAGGAYVPLDPAYPAQRLQYMLEDTQAAVLLTQSEQAATVAGYGGKTICLDREWERISSYSAANPVCEVSGENLAYVIYTSGSTGWPKGVGIRHSSAMVLLQWGREVFSEEELNGVLAATSICFDLSVFEIFVPLSWGGKVIVAANALELPRIGVREQVKLVNTVPSVMKELVRREGVPRSVVTVNLAGEALLGSLVREVYGMEGVRRVLNLYGPTEDTTYSTWAWIGQEEACAGEKAGVSIGKPVANTGVYVLDEELQPAPVGVAGELYLGGAGLARGYVNQPGLTAERFAPSPFANRGGERLYRTGDRARWRRDGDLEYLGRLDQQVKIRGYRIELGEIEAALQKQAGVAQAAVVAPEDVPGEKRLVAYVVGAVKEEGSGQVELKGSELRQQLRGRLPEYMVPSAYVQLEELPLNANGKLDRTRLPQPEAGEAGAQDRKRRTVEEEILCGIWSEVLKVDRVGIEDNFFVLGGHSLLATQVISRTRTAFGVELPLRALFETNTLAEFATQVERALKKEKKAEIPSIVPLPREGTFPLSFAEQRLWFLQQMEPASAAYNCPVMLRLSGELDQEVVAGSLQAVVRRHEMLRTTFPLQDGSPVQKINQDMAPQLHVTDLESLPDEEKEKTVEQFAAEEANKPFDLATGPLFRVQLLRLNREEHILLVTMHHIITDAWSDGILIREFVELYTAYCQGRAPQLEELSLQYADFAVWQRNWLRDEVIEKQLEFWQKQLEGAATLALPHDYPRPSQPTHEGALMQFTVASDMLDKLKQLSRQEGVTLFMTLMAAFQLLLARYAEQDDIVVATPIANRSQRFMESLVGFFVNALVVRTDLGGDPAFAELLARVRETMLEVYDHQDTPFEKVIDHLLSDRDSTRSPFLDVTFVLQNVQTEQFVLPGLELKQCLPSNMPTKVDISLVTEESHVGLNGLLHYSTEVFSAESMARFLQHYVALLSGIAQDSKRNISEFSLLTSTEEQEVLIQWNDTTTSYPSITADLLYRAHAERKGDAPAVVLNGTTLTYEQLDQETNQLARYLQKLGVGPETRVGLYVDRGLAIARGVLGIWKAGGAYLPLDPSYPPERLAYMVEDAQVGIILTQESLRADSPFQHTFDIYLDSDWPQIAQESTDSPVSNVSPLNTAYVIYTSGSTGKPKGTSLIHQGLCNLAHAQQEIFQLPDHSAVLQFASISFDAATWEISMSLLAGHRLVMGPRDQLLPGMDLVDLIRRNGVTALTIPPSALAALPQEELPDLQTLVLAGETCGQELVNKWSHGRKMFDAYGPTETTVCATISAPLSRHDRQAPSIGRPLPNMRVYVLDQDLRPSPVGIAGELYVGGTGLARGYVNRCDLTAERFIPNPYSQSCGERLYKTGDRARWRANGQMEFLGRRDAQVKVRGFRIELEEIEAVLKQHPTIQQAAVVVQERGNDNKRIIGFVVPQRPAESHLQHSPQSNGHHVSHHKQTTSKPFDLVAIKKHLLAQLPEYMVPSVLVELDQLPLTPNGKIDRKALAERPDDEEKMAVRNMQRERPMTAVEEIVAAIWMDVLRVEQVKTEQNFFEIGGHSLLATQVISRIREAFGIDLGLHALFENPHLHRLAEMIEEERQEAATISMPPVQRADRSKDLPLSFAQQRLWFIDQLDPGNPAYNATFGARLSGELNYNAVRQSLIGIVQRHEILRTSFQTISNEPRQIIGPVGNIVLRVVDLSGADPEKREAEARQLAHHEHNTRFDLTQRPLMRVVLVKLDTHEHLLLTTMHHIVSDGWSLAIVVREFSRLYEGHCQGKSVQLEELAIQYADFAVWQREWLQGEVLKEQLEYWKGQLAEAPVLELPTDKSRPAVASHRGQSVTFELSQDLTEKLLALARRESVTPFMLLLAAYQVLLCRYTGQEDIVVGTPIANRNRAEIEPLIGFFVNQIALRSKIRRDGSFSELLAAVRALSLGAYAHQDLPFEKLVEELSPERTLSHAPLFQVIFALQNVPHEEIHLSGLKVAAFVPEREFEKVDLNLVMEEREGILKGELGYATDLFEKSTIERFIGHFCRMLEDVAQDPSKSIESLILLTVAEREQLLETWNPPQVVQPAQSQCLHELFEAQVKRIPKATAVVYEGKALTYAALNQKANQLARYLRSLGIERELRVGIFLERSLDTIVAVLGTLKAGAAYVALDSGLPTERLAQMIEDVQVAVLITGEKLRDKLPSVWAQVISIDQDWETIAQEESNNLAISVSSDCLAYVIFTSGSTGKPKAVGIEHRQICSYTNAVANRLQMQEGWSYGLISTFAADLGNTTFFPSLCIGGTLHIIAEDRSRDRNAMTQYVQEHGVLDCLKITPTQLRVLVESGSPSVVPAKRLVVGGEATTWEWAQEWQSIRPECGIWNHYGPTESTVGVCTFDISGAMSKSSPVHGDVLLGKPLPHSRLYVLDEADELVPVGVPGELYIGGEGVGRGYLNSSSATAEKFVPDPFVGAGSRVYRSGDRVRWTADGNLEFLGRKDKQVKLRGYRIELGEIESILNQHSGVRQGAVVFREDEPGQKQLVAYVVPRWQDDHSTQDASRYRLGNGLPAAQQNKNETASNPEPVAVTSSELRAYLAKKLPEYMVPADFVTLDKLPLLANGKLDYEALPRPGQCKCLENYKNPRTPIEEILAGIWSEVLKVDRVGVEDNFFVLGGHSLLATQVISRAQAALGTELSLRMLFEEPTIAGLAGCVERAKKQSPPLMSQITPVSRELPLPLSYGQQRLWFLQQLDRDSSLYNLPYALRFTGSLDQSALRSALSEIVRRHEVLRTRYEVVDGEAVQCIDPSAPVPIEHIDLRHVVEPEAEALALAEKYAREAFDLTYGPLMRVRLLQLGDRDYVLCLVLHHIASDGWSVGILVREFMELYRAEREEGKAALEELPIQYGDYAVWQREWLGGGELQEQMGYWKKQLAGLETLDLPTDHVRPAVMSHRGATVEMELGEELTGRIRELCRREGVTLFMVLLGGVQVLLGRYAGQEEVAVGTPIANRTRREIEPLIGFFVNTLVLRGEVRREWSFREMLKQIREVTLAAYARQDVPFEQLVEELQPERDLSRNPLFQVMLIVQNTPQESFSLPGLSVEGLGTEGGEVAKFDLTFSATESGGKIRIGINYATELYEQATIERMGRHFCAVVEEMSRNADSRIGEVSILSEAERAQLAGWNRTEREYPQGWVHELFEEQVGRTPGAVAVEYEDQHLNYEELNRRANQLAHYLRSMGVGPEVRVGICMERSLEMVISIMAVLKAGGAYVPLDPGYPADRLSYMLEGSAAPVLLGQARLQEKWLSYRGKTIHVDAEWGMIGRCSDANLGNEVSGENLAYVIYTSGSTGKPKGAMNTHRGLSNRVQWMQQAYGLTAGDRVLQKTPFGFDVSVWEFVWPLMVGARLVMLRPGGHQDPACIAETIQGKQITTLHFVPAMLRAFLAYGGARQSGSLCRIISSGEALDRDLARECQEQIGAELHNLYGPTEASIDVTFWDCGELSDEVMIGRPIANTQIHVLDSELQPVPVGVWGELYIGGVGVGRGYVNQPGLTGERFVPNPLASSSGGERLYRTGDRVKRHEDGNLEYLGRLDQQVKLRGYRIELGEIEAALQEQAGVAQAVVIVREDVPGDKRLVAYVVGEVKEEGSGQVELEGRELRRYVQERLPEYMVPSAYVQMEELPLNASGKLDRKKLRETALVRSREAAERVAPRNPAEKLVAEIWAEVLHHSDIGVETNFFEIGGHSLQATQIIARIRTAFQIEEFPLRRIFQTPTIAGLVHGVEEAVGGESVAETIAELVQEIRALSPEQVEAMLASNQLSE